MRILKISAGFTKLSYKSSRATPNTSAVSANTFRSFICIPWPHPIQSQIDCRERQRKPSHGCVADLRDHHVGLKEICGRVHKCQGQRHHASAMLLAEHK